MREAMGKYFGTDGVRGIANKKLTPEMAFQLGRCGGHVLTGQAKQPTLLIGQDTRISSPMLEAALVAGLLSIGANVIRLGVAPTPAVAYLTRKLKANASVMITASHNPVEDNGIKFFGSDGFKLSDEKELEIEALMDAAVDGLPRPIGAELGRLSENFTWKHQYVDFLKKTLKTDDFTGMKIVVDGANGAAYELAPRIFCELGATVIAISTHPDGININDQCGSTHLAPLKHEVLRHKANVGLAFDGDADRMIAIDETGEEIDGDYLLAIFGDALYNEGRLKQGTIVTTVMSNLGFFKSVEALGLQTKQTAVGDRYVIAEMAKGDYNLGGEQSGHIIFLDHNTTGDGLLAALQLVDTMLQSGQKLSELKQKMSKYPQVLMNVQVGDKNKLKGNAVVEAAVRKVETQLAEQGRVLVRPSGTESLIRVMAEGSEIKELQDYVKTIAEVITKELA
jgi:phosphoglucosamine mutase